MVDVESKWSESKRIGIVGLGVLGGSLVKAITKYTTAEVYGYDCDAEAGRMAETDGSVRQMVTDMPSLIEKVDVLIYALPPAMIPNFVKEYRELLRPGMIVSDVASTKSRMMEAIYEVLPQNVSYVSIHPMAGSEKSGYAVAKEDLFVGRPWIVLRDEKHDAWTAEAHQFFIQLGNALGARIEEVKLEEHDALIARISHLPHVTAAMVMQIAGSGEEGKRCLRLAAGGFRDHTRVSGGNPALWSDIIMSNCTEVRSALTELRNEADLLLQALDANDGEALQRYLQEARLTRHIYEKIEGEIE